MRVVSIFSVSLSVMMSSLWVVPTHGLDAASIKAAKRATALVEIPGGRGSASAFCVNKKGYFITNQHVSRAARQNEKIKLVLWPTEKDQTVVDANIVREDETLDLALLCTTTNLTLTALGISDAEELVETTEVTAFGYPFGKSLATEDNLYPAISINVGRITSLRRKEGELYRIQIDAEVNPGNSGGPLVGPDGKVVGVIVAGIFGSAVNFAIPSGHLERFLARPKLAFAPPTLTVSNLSSDVVFKVDADTIFELTTPMAITLTLTPGAMDPRTHTMTRMADGSYETKTQILPPSDNDGVLSVTAEFEDSTLKCRLPDMSVKVDDRQTALRDIKMVRTQKTTEVTMKDGSKHIGSIAGLGVVRTKVGKKPVDIDFSKATGIAVVDLSAISFVRYSVRAIQNGKSLETLEGVIGVKGASGLGDQLMKGLVLRYTFDLIEGERVADLGGRTQGGRLEGGDNIAGRVGSAVHLNGESRVRLDKRLTFDKAMSLSAWFTIDSNFGLVAGMPGPQAYVLLINTPTDIYVGTAHGSGQAFWRLPNPLSPRLWHHGVVTWDGTDATVYLDGESLGSRSISSISPVEYIGFGQASHHQGNIDEVMIFDRPLTQEEAQDLYRHGKYDNGDVPKSKDEPQQNVSRRERTIETRNRQGP